MAEFAKEAGGELFSYNRENWKFNNELRQKNLYQQQKMRVRQVDLYREDLHDLFGLTIGKMDNYATVSVILLIWCIEMFYKGRIPSPTQNFLFWAYAISLGLCKDLSCPRTPHQRVSLILDVGRLVRLPPAGLPLVVDTLCGTFGADVGAGKLKGRGGHNHNSPSVTLEEIQDKILEMAMDRSGSRVLQKLISDTSASAADGGAHDELEKLIDAIIHEIQPVLSRIMCDTYANYMCQQLFQVSSASQRIALLRNVLENIVYISQDRRGTHSLQALIACMQTPQEHALLAETLHGNVNKMALDVHATHVLQQTITKCTPDGPGKEYSHLPMADFGFIFDDIYRNLEALAGDPNGLGVVKKCISHAPWYDDGSYVEKNYQRLPDSRNKQKWDKVLVMAEKRCKKV
ncbi:hypothetical protein Pmar_PMAR000231 [Perkinsus marinus ATCC 50983]|uniref:PUM-HD domain-containing protein n=1 Tax=Perkinsus marinus (strain ATCC 50983 / TXsc) TaxID=423536 RepID=C5LNV9_PERM5|nr:hypothetical protein Pmar_PMAR000231 [Perkinsus marinus ATCC 50983]EER01541.1 hypothetical protein Pmar_PMAR000231 [Perkinsus marinus ATCC 50983]|eukprot:XP_002768823.1 hypothetical protein Pmar_PMAR000231 [Perkinsus marinus ATCC 50983]